MNDPSAGCPCRASTRQPEPSRREFLAASLLAAVGSVLASACGSETGPSPGFTGTFSVTVADYPTLATVGGIALLQNPPSPMAAVRTGAGSFAVFSRLCPHQGTTIGLNGTGFRCPNHGALFDSQGHNVGGQSTSSLHQYAASYDAGTDTLTVTG